MKYVFLAFWIGLVWAPSVAAQNVYKTLQPSFMQRDLAVLHAAFTTLHPGIYRYQTQEQFEVRFAKAIEICKKPLDERRFFIILSQLAEGIHCGHTYPNPLNLPDSVADRFLPKTVIPVCFRVSAKNTFIITHNLSENKSLKAGDEIMAINGITTGRIVDSLLTVSRSDGLNAIGKKRFNLNVAPDELDNLSLFDVYFPFFFTENSGSSFLLTFTKADHQSKTIVVDGASLASRLGVYKARYGTLPTYEKSYIFQMLTPKTAYFSAGTFGFWNSKFPIEAYIDSVMGAISSNPKIKGLVLDIRANEGGNDELAFQILSYLSKKPLGCDRPDRLCYRFLTVPDSLKPFLRTWDPSFAAPKKPEDYSLNDIGLYEKKATTDPCRPYQPKLKQFTGKVVLLMGPKNSSATFEMARNFQTYKLGKTVGEPSGGTLQGLNGGKMFFLRLPGSMFEMDLPIQWYYHPGAPDKGIIPDVVVQPTRKDIENGVDAALAEAQRILNK